MCANSQRRGPKHPDGHLVANQLGGGLAALLMQTARGVDPSPARYGSSRRTSGKARQAKNGGSA